MPKKPYLVFEEAAPIMDGPLSCKQPGPWIAEGGLPLPRILLLAITARERSPQGLMASIKAPARSISDHFRAVIDGIGVVEGGGG